MRCEATESRAGKPAPTGNLPCEINPTAAVVRNGRNSSALIAPFSLSGRCAHAHLSHVPLLSSCSSPRCPWASRSSPARCSRDMLRCSVGTHLLRVSHRHRRSCRQVRGAARISRTCCNGCMDSRAWIKPRPRRHPRGSPAPRRSADCCCSWNTAWPRT